MGLVVAMLQSVERDERGGVLPSTLPGPHLAAALAELSPASVDDYDLVEVIKAWERQIAWAMAGQIRAISELVQRPVYADGPDSPWALAGMEIGAALRLSRSTAQGRTAVAETLTEDLPDTLVALGDGEIDYGRARALAEGVVGLEQRHRKEVEALVLPKAAGRTLRQHQLAIERAIIVVDPEGAQRQHDEAAERRRVFFQPLPSAMGEVRAELTADGLALVREMLDSAAVAIKTSNPGDIRTMDQLRADALVDLAKISLQTGWLGGVDGGLRLANAQGRRPTIQVTVPYSTLIGLDEQPGELAGYGPIPAVIARQIAADGTWRRLLTDPATGALVDYGAKTYEPPASLRDFVIARDRTCRGVTCGQPAHRAQLDHTVPYPLGPTSAINLGALCAPDHIAKTHGKWQLTQPEPGRFIWRSPAGRIYEVPPEQVGPIIADETTVPRGLPPVLYDIANVEPPDVAYPEEIGEFDAIVSGPSP